jgi:hypothetical protein
MCRYLFGSFGNPCWVLASFLLTKKLGGYSWIFGAARAIKRRKNMDKEIMEIINVIITISIYNLIFITMLTFFAIFMILLCKEIRNSYLPKIIIFVCCVFLAYNFVSSIKTTFLYFSCDDPLNWIRSLFFPLQCVSCTLGVLTWKKLKKVIVIKNSKKQQKGEIIWNFL